MAKNILEWFFSIVIAIVAAWLITSFVFSRYEVHGESMYPTFKDGDNLIVSKISKPLETIDRGDVIVLHSNEKRDYIKRLIGVPGDTIQYKRDQLYINGEKVSEPYLEFNKEHKVANQLTEDFNVSDTKYSEGKKEIPKGKYLVLGDNRLNSNDSRGKLGLISDNQIVGKAKIRVLPTDNMQYDFYSDSFDNVNQN
ncbi:signal peptidase I [Mammaliicoccus lentus]|jgi:signal peptidase I|uniref:Signal peptidase I n=1 Tax=Mammaliicoccus lentus TaxID=42858 RepID=A0AAX3W529_MAMLE|nr:signal peptidase I [Mammaliicoccus lentus]WHI60401.1 signal peptidase I [Mammaliicoccus lentus]